MTKGDPWNRLWCAACGALLTAAVVAGSITPPDAGAADARPNVVLIITDDQGYGDLGCHGNPILRTPHLDRLFRQSVRLTNFHTDPTCSPTRAALMSGRYATRTGVWHTVMGRHLPRRTELLMPQVFADSGYQTAIFGKWHLGDTFPFRPQDRGFGEVLIHGGGGVGQIPDYWGNDYFDDTYFHNGEWKPFEGYCTDVFFREAIRFIAASRERPFFVYLTTNAPHGPYRVEDRYRAPYADRVGNDAELAAFYGMIANLDENVGRLLSRLDELQVADNTIVIFMTDNGTARGATFADYRGNGGQLLSGYNAGMRGRKGSPYEGGHRVPCFVRWPDGRLGGGRDVPQLAAHFDWLPTLIELCQLSPPAERDFDGVSLAELLRGRNPDPPQRTLLVHHQELPLPQKYRFGCVMQGAWRLILRNDLQDSRRYELYDLSTDPSQTLDLLPNHPRIARRLRQAYEDWWSELSVEFDKFSEAVVGDPRHTPVHLTCFDWHSSRRWWQNNVRDASVDNGFWALDVQQPGEYLVELRRWPPQVDLPLSAEVDGGRRISPVSARLRVGSVEMERSVPDNVAGITFRVRLDAGSTRLQTWLVDADGGSRGAYYVTIDRGDP